MAKIKITTCIEGLGAQRLLTAPEQSGEFFLNADLTLAGRPAGTAPSKENSKKANVGPRGSLSLLAISVVASAAVTGVTVALQQDPTKTTLPLSLEAPLVFVGKTAIKAMLDGFGLGADADLVLVFTNGSEQDVSVQLLALRDSTDTGG